mmetsp:Transcript_1037/g.3048  ORF Transcript_1037/g.3048 Transcript_1037/m.3048 type:complete len:222 (+) Transcript_1037:1918-2583(+)
MPGHRAARRHSIAVHVDADLLRHHPFLDRAHLGVLAAAAEQARRLHHDVAHLLQVAVHERKLVHAHLLLLGQLLLHLLLLGSVPPRFPLLLQMLPDQRKVALVKFLDHVVSAQHLLEAVEEVLVEDGSQRWIAQLRAVGSHQRVKRGHLLLLLGQVHRLAVVQQLDAVRLVVGREEHAVVTQRAPLLALGQLFSLPPLERTHHVLQLLRERQLLGGSDLGG